MNTSIHHNRIEHKYKLGISRPEDREAKLKSYYWIWGLGSRHIVLGPFSSYEEAQHKSLKLDCPAEIEKLNTRDEAQASRILRAKLLGETGSVEESFHRFKHTMKKES